MEYPLVLKNVLPAHLFASIQDDLRYWENVNKSYKNTDNDAADKFLGRTKPDELVFREAQTIIKYKLQRNFEYHLQSDRVMLNAAFPNTRGSVFHRDDNEECYLTFVLFSNLKWNTQWGGETVMYDGESYKYVPYIPNSGCLFPSHWEHYGASPNAHASSLRTSIAFMYKVCYNNPIKRNTL